MFDLFTGVTKHSPRHRALPVLVSVVAHVVVAGTIVIGGVLLAEDQFPEVRTMMAFAAPPPLPPPPPPAPQETPPTEVKPVPVSADAAPVESPPEIVPEAPVTDVAVVDVYDGEGRVPGGGIVGGVSVAEVLPPPPPPPPAPLEPIRIGGQIQQPTLVHRVSPVYPDVAVSVRVEGTVILEAIVDEDGRVEDLKVLRSSGVLDRAALAAVRQWRYTPVVLNGRAAKFILTVVVTFSLSDAR